MSTRRSFFRRCFAIVAGLFGARAAAASDAAHGSHCVSTTRHGKPTSVADVGHHVTSYVYDRVGKLVSMTDHSSDPN